MAHLLLHASGHLTKHSSGHLKLYGTWHSASLTTTGWSGFNNYNPASTKENINYDPLTTAYPIAKAAAISAFASGSYTTTDCVASVGAAFDTGGAARSTVYIGGEVYSFVPASVSLAARIAVSAVCNIGVFASAPNAGQILGATEYTPVAGYVNLADFLTTINDCAGSSSTCYITTCRPPPTSLTGTIEQQSFTNDYGEDILLWGWCPVANGETLYWKTGTSDTANFPLTSSGVSLFY